MLIGVPAWVTCLDVFGMLFGARFWRGNMNPIYAIHWQKEWNTSPQNEVSGTLAEHHLKLLGWRNTILVKKCSVCMASAQIYGWVPCGIQLLRIQKWSMVESLFGTKMTSLSKVHCGWGGFEIANHGSELSLGHRQRIQTCCKGLITWLTMSLDIVLCGAIQCQSINTVNLVENMRLSRSSDSTCNLDKKILWNIAWLLG